MTTGDPIKLAFPLIGRGSWTGGFVYLKNTLRLIRSRLAHQIAPSVFLSPAEFEKFGAELSPLVDGRMVVDQLTVETGRRLSLASALISGNDRGLERLLKSHNTDCAFEVGNYYGAKFGLPVISWMPDFQHHYMPEMFSRYNWWRRDLGFRAQIRAGRTLMLSSETARQDLERFYPMAQGRGHVVKFAIDLDVASYLGRGAEMRTTYGLPDRFFFLPNQFWRHKNHAVVIDALAHIKVSGGLAALPPIVLSGLPKDARNPAHFDQLMARARDAGIDAHFRYLGLIPYDHVLSLTATCDTLINPSQFEGWSTPIEEAKAFGTPLMLSDIPIHREQAPDAHFVDHASRLAVAEALIERSRQPLKPHAAAPALQAAQNQRLDRHAASLLATVRAAVRAGI